MSWTTKEEMKRSKAKRKRVITTIVGIVFLTIPLLSFVIDPITTFMDYNFRLRNGSYLFDVFKTEVEGSRMSLFVFNVTNADQFLSGEDFKLKVEEVGPFTYVEIRRNGDIDLNVKDEEMTFTPFMKLKFLPEASIARPEDVNVSVPNLSLLSATTLLEKYPVWIQRGFNILASQLQAKAIINLDAHSYLWGYKDPLITLANTITPKLIYFEKLGIMDRLYENKTMFRMTVGTSEADKFSIKSLKKYLKQDNWQKHEPLESYHFDHTYEGVVYPPNLTIRTPINIFRLGVCRPLRLEFHEQKTMSYGVDAWVYKISSKTFTSDCGKGVCGMLDLSSCTYGIPIALSRTHFLNSNPVLYERIDGMTPDPNKHDSVFVVEPKMGFALATSLSLQLNLVLEDIRFNAKVAKFSDMIVPIAYIKVSQLDLADDRKLKLKVLYVILPKVLLAIEITLIIMGLLMLAYSLKIFWKYRSASAGNVAVTNKKHNLPLIRSKAV